MHAQVFGTRRIGRPRKGWVDNVEEDLKQIHIEDLKRRIGMNGGMFESTIITNTLHNKK